MSYELALIAFAMITMTAITVEILYTYATQGFGFGFSSNRPIVEKSSLGLRIERAYRNQVEAAGYVVPVLIAAALTDLDGAYVALATALIIAGRAVFILLYYTGIPFIRILGFTTSSLATLYLAAAFLGLF